MRPSRGGLAPEAYVRVTQLVFGPYTPFPVEFRIMGPDPAELYRISEKALALMAGVPDVRQANRDWGNRAPILRFVPDQDRLNLIGLSPTEAAQQMQLLLTGIPITSTREHPQRSRGGAQCCESRLDPSRLADFSLMSRSGRQVPLDQVGHSEIRFEEPILKRRDRTPVLTYVPMSTNPRSRRSLPAGDAGAAAADRLAPRRLPYRDGRQYRGNPLRPMSRW